MTIDRAIAIFDPDNPETYKDAAEIEEAMRMAVDALKALKPYGGIYVGLGDYEDGNCVSDNSVYAMICAKLIELGVLKYERDKFGYSAQWMIRAVKLDD